jgi:hypothetical protein
MELFIFVFSHTKFTSSTQALSPFPVFDNGKEIDYTMILLTEKPDYSMLMHINSRVSSHESKIL